MSTPSPKRYLALVHKEDGSDYGVSFPALPGCISAGATLEEAEDNAAEALDLHLRGLAANREDSEAIDMETVLEQARDEGAVVLFIAPRA
ncbi:MAG: type II toxin-antitoxin system HicB family antitoxin [Rhodospirillales bacterium]|nr:type II toxin-antitoxin system HicB family antitoxin [Rhodospirillales bacterium]